MSDVYQDFGRTSRNVRLWHIAAVKRTCAATLYVVGVCLNRIGTHDCNGLPRSSNQSHQKQVIIFATNLPQAETD